MAKDEGTCWIDGRKTAVKPRQTIIPGVKVKTCADGKGCDTKKAK